MTQPTNEKVAIAEQMREVLRNGTHRDYTHDLDLLAEWHLQQTTHLREQLQLKESQVGRCVEALEEAKETFKRQRTYQRSLDKHATADYWHELLKETEQLLSSLPTTPNYVKRVEELEEDFRALHEAVRAFRKLEILGKLTKLRSTKEYLALCDAWKYADDTLNPQPNEEPQQTLNKQV